MTVPTPEHDKLTAAIKEPRDGVLADFIDFLGSRGIHFGQYPTSGEFPGEDEDDGECGLDFKRHYHDSDRVTYHDPPDYMVSVGGPTQYSQWIAEFYGVDYKAFNDEKEAIYREISEAENAR